MARSQIEFFLIPVPTVFATRCKNLRQKTQHGCVLRFLFASRALPLPWCSGGTLHKNALSLLLHNSAIARECISAESQDNFTDIFRAAEYGVCFFHFADGEYGMDI